MICAKCGAEGREGATFCNGCGRSLRGSGGRLVGRLACSGLLVFGFVILLASLAPLLFNQVADWSWSATGAFLVAASLYFLGGRSCPHPSGLHKNFCPDCGRAHGKQPNPLRLSCLVFAGGGVALVILLLPILYWMGYLQAGR